MWFEVSFWIVECYIGTSRVLKTTWMMMGDPDAPRRRIFRSLKSETMRVEVKSK